MSRMDSTGCNDRPHRTIRDTVLQIVRVNDRCESYRTVGSSNCWLRSAACCWGVAPSFGRSRPDSDSNARTITGVIDVIGSDFADIILGNVFANLLTGGDGGDSLNGGDGFDFFQPGSGADTVNGTAAGNGNQAYDDRDYVSYNNLSDFGRGVIVNLSTAAITVGADTVAAGRALDPTLATDTLIDIAIAEKRPDEVLRWYDRRKPRSRGWDSGWFAEDRVAEALVKTYPERALAIWKRLAEAQIALTNPKAYEQAAGYLRKVHRVLKQLGKEQDWSRYLAALRRANERKRRLVQILDTLAGRRIIEGL